MPPYGNDAESGGRKGELGVAVVVLLLALSASLVSEGTQQRISAGLQMTVLRPFITTQQSLEEARVGRAEADSLVALVDSLSAILSTQSALVDENRTLRSLLGIAERAGPSYLPATVLRPGTPGSESMFIVDVGAADGVRAGAPVVSPFGLVGVIREVRTDNAVGMDWSHPDFRVSAMLSDGSGYGLVGNRPGPFRETDRLLLNGLPYNLGVASGVTVVTSGLGGVFPRGIPIGRIVGLADEEGNWRKSYWLVPMTESGAATHVLVLTDDAGDDVGGVWSDPIGDPAAVEEDGR